MSFKTDIPNYKSYDSKKYYMNYVPDSIWNKFQGLILRSACDEDETIVSIFNKFVQIIPCRTINYRGVNYNDTINNFAYEIKKTNKFDVFMDCFATLCTIGYLGEEEANEFLEDNDIGYLLSIERLYGTPKAVWHLRDDSQFSIDNINKTQEAIKSVSQQAYEEFEQAKRNLEHVNDERAIKDAVRNCASALEAIIKEYGKYNDIKQASKKLRDSRKWGLDCIIKDGCSIFDKLHELYPDLRHGTTNEKASLMSKEEAEYWADRITAYLRYMKKMADKNKM